MIKRVLGAIGDIQEKYPLIVILAVLTLSSFFMYYAIRLETDSSFDVMQRPDSEALKYSDLIDNEFGGTDQLFILVSVDQEMNDKNKIQDLRDPAVLEALTTLKRSLEGETYVVEATSVADLYLGVYGRLPKDLDESKIMLETLPEDVKERYLGSLVSEDFQYLNMFVSVSVESKPGFLEKIEADVKSKIDQTPFPIGVKSDLTGLPILINRIMLYLINDNMSTVMLAIVGIIIILWIYFRSLRIAVMSSIPTILTLIWLAGSMYLLDIQMTIMVASVGAMMVGLSVDYSIHLTHRYHRNVQEGKKGATKDTVVNIGSALFASVMTTTAGFLALTLGISPNSQVQGKILALGVVYAFIISMALLPALMVLQRKYLYSKLDEMIFKVRGRKDKKGKSIVDKFLQFMAKVQVKSPSLVLIATGIITILIVPGFGLVYLDTDDDNWVPDGDTVVMNMENVGYNFGGTESMNLLFMLDTRTDEQDSHLVTDLRDPRVIVPMGSLDKVIEKLDWVNSIDSVSNEIRLTNDDKIPKDRTDVKRVIMDNPAARTKFNDDFSIAMYTMRADSIDRNDYFELLREMDSVTFPEEVEIIPQGSVPDDIEFEQTMEADAIKTTLIGFVLVIIIATLFYRSFVKGLLAFIPIIFAIIWTVGLMGYINLPFTVLTTGMLAILMGMGIDFSIHIIHSIDEAMEEYKNDLSRAVPHAIVSTGQAISTTTITTIVGFLALSFATLVNTMRLGWTLALGIFATFFTSMFIVPAVMVLLYRFRLRNERMVD